MNENIYFQNDDQQPVGCFGMLLSCVIGIIFCIIISLLAGCSTPEPVIIEKVRTEYKTKHDTLIKTDSVIDRQTTIIREVDSSVMADYGIRLDQFQRAWLIEVNRLQNEKNTLLKSRGDTQILRDSIPVPYPVVKRVPRELTKWQKIKIKVGEFSLIIIISVCGFYFVKRRK